MSFYSKDSSVEPSKDLLCGITALKGSLPAWPQKREDCSGLDCAANLERYFDHYGFGDLHGSFSRYEFGSVTSGRYEIACHRWCVEGAKARCVLVHGLFDHVGLYLPLIHTLLQSGIDVLAFDLPEHGLSSGVYGELDSFHDYADALHNVLVASASAQQQGAAERPLYAIGQSTGAAALMCYLQQYFDGSSDCPFDRLVLLAPLVRVRAWRRINYAYRLFKVFLKRVPREFSLNSHDPDFDAFLKSKDPLQPRYISVKWVGAMLAWAQQFNELEVYDIPGALIQGTADNTVGASFNVPHICSKFPNIDVHEIDGAYHHLVREAEHWQSQVYRNVLEALE